MIYSQVSQASDEKMISAKGRLPRSYRILISQLCDYLRNSLCTLHTRRVIHPRRTEVSGRTAFVNVIVVCTLAAASDVPTWINTFYSSMSIFGLSDLSARSVLTQLPRLALLLD